MSDYVLELSDVTKRYDDFTLDHVSFQVSKRMYLWIYRTEWSRQNYHYPVDFRYHKKG